LGTVGENNVVIFDKFRGLELYADESGTHDVTGKQPGSEVLAVIGYIAGKSLWLRMSRKWNRHLRRAGVTKPFHMREFYNDPPYNSWTQSKRDRFLRRMVNTARNKTWFTVGATVQVKDYNEVVPKWLKDDDQHPYFFSFRLLLDAILHLLVTEIDPHLKTKESVACIFDRQEEFREQATKTFYGLKALRDPDNRLSSIDFGSRAKYVPLQAADLMAYYGRRIVAHRLKGEAWRDPIERLLEKKHSLMIYTYDRVGLVNWVLEVTRVRDVRILRERKDDMSFILLSDQMAVWNEWYEDALKKGGGAIPEWEARVMRWDRKQPMDADLWARLLEWKKAKSSE
jgi:hypothetical protein